MLIENREFIVSGKASIASISSDIYKLRHRPSGLEVLYVKNSDKNKVFSATFRTPPQSDSGVAHILEHSVLCGSQKYNARDLFNELMKGSVNTYLNAMTFSDKTMYPVASMNEKDFCNLVSVYLDSVFNPLLRPEFFYQEGWSYEIRKKSAPLEINGIVYNEMKGAYAQPERLLIKKIDEALFDGTPYRYDSGGVPHAIYDLTYEQLIGFYKRYYRPSNCLLYLYGDLDINVALTLVSEALKNHTAAEAPAMKFSSGGKRSNSEITESFYSVNEAKADSSYYAVSFAACEYTDSFTTMALELLNYILGGNDASPVRNAFRQSGLCGDFSAYFRESSYQTSFSFVGKNCLDGRFDDFSQLLHETLRKTETDGIDKKLINAALNKWEFFINEEDFGDRPSGLFYGVLAASAWVYGGDAAEALKIKETFRRVAAEAGNGLFERLLRKYLIENNNTAYTVLSPKQNLIEEETALLAKKLSGYKESLSEESLDTLIAQTRALEKFRKKPDRKRDLNRIPSLSSRDISPQIFKYRCEHGETALFCPHEKHGIEYINLHFNLNRIPSELIPYCGFLKEVLGRTDTESYSAAEIINRLNSAAGNVRYTSDVLAHADGSFIPRFNIKLKALGKNTETALTLISEITSPRLDVSIIDKIRNETLLKAESGFRSNGHSIAINRALSYAFASANYTDLISGIGFYNELCRKTPEEIIGHLKELIRIVFCRENLFVGASSYERAENAMHKVSAFSRGLNTAGEVHPPSPIGKNPCMNEGFTLDGGVSYNAKAYNLYDAADRYSGTLLPAKSLLSLSLLWQEIRNSGGAYGCGAGFGRSGGVYFYSYRDPEIIKTYGVFDRCFKALEEYNGSRRDFERYVINALKPFERPLKPHEILEMAVSDRFLGITDEMRQTERDELLSATPADMNAIGKTLSVLRGHYCTLGNKSKVESENIFTQVSSLKQSKG